jgi:predicted DNA-binding antitoxin AbrB/MazE fold protein
MSLIVEATYKNGALAVDRPLPLKENERVTITIESPVASSESNGGRLTYGLVGWKGDVEVVRRVALDPEFGVQESR